MKVKLQNGVILEPKSDELANQIIKHNEAEIIQDKKTRSPKSEGKQE